MILEITEYMRKNFYEILKGNQWENIDKESILTIIKWERLKIDEKLIWLLVKGWIEFKKNDREKYIDELFYFIKFPLMDSDFLDNEVFSSELWSVSILSRNLMREIFQ